jgi:replicative DNA helicase
MADDGGNGEVRPIANAPSDPAPPDAGPAVRTLRRQNPLMADLDAEAALLGSVLDRADVAWEAASVLGAADFAWPSYGRIFETMRLLADTGRSAGIGPISVADELRKADALHTIGTHHGGDVGIVALNLLTSPGVAGWRHASVYAGIVARHATERRVALEATEALDAVRRGDLDTAAERLRGATTEIASYSVVAGPATSRLVSGADFILEEGDATPAVWGEGENILWASGEGLMLVGPQGVGKTTLGQQLALSCAGLRDELLGWPVQQTERRVLYIAADRPRQAARSMKRMVSDADRPKLAERLEVWKGPLPFDLTGEPERLSVLANERAAGVVVIDSLKDVARKLSDEESGQAVNNAIQHCLAAGIEVVVLHHQRKEQRGAGKPTQLADVYGSTWITGGIGSVVLLWGEPGDAVVELSHLKQPVADVGPLELLHDHEAGTTTLERGFDLLAYMRGRPNGATVADVAIARYSTTSPKPNQIQKCRRLLEAARTNGLVARPEEPALGGHGGSTAARYYLVATREEHQR